MNMIVVSDRKVLECGHCRGTTLCAHSVLVECDHDGGDRRLVQRCSQCGDGVARHSAILGKLQESKPPICRVCGGRGCLVL